MSQEAPMPNPMSMLNEKIEYQARTRSNAHYALAKARLKVTQLEAVIAGCDRELAVLEQAQAVVNSMEGELAQALEKATAQAVAATTPPLPVDGPPAHITQPVKPPVTRASPKRQAAGKKTGRPPGRPKGSGAKKAPDAIHNEATVPGGNAKMNGGMTPGQAVEMGL